MLAVIDRNRNVEALTAGAAGLSITYALSVSSVTSQVFHQPVVVAYTSFWLPKLLQQDIVVLEI